MSELKDRLVDILQKCPGLMQVMRAVRDVDIPDWMIFSGAIYQPVVNHLTGRPLEHGLKDYDVAYFDASDTSYEAEDVVIRRVAAAFEPPLSELVEVRNQARVHLWFEDHFGEPYSALTNSAEALTRFVSPSFAVAARLEADDRMTILAPFGLDDLFALRFRPNPNRSTDHFPKIAAKMKARWPEIAVEA